LGDPAHHLDHVKRVVSWSMRLTLAEGARAEVTFPAAWLHDCVVVAKDSPERNRASGLAAQRAVDFLRKTGYALASLAEIAHVIEAHSFSARIAPRTIEACVVQDADRLDAIGAIGIARCLITGASLSRPLYSATDPFCRSRNPDERTATIDHFYTKLLGLAESMKTTTGRMEAHSRTDFMVQYLSRLESEIAIPDDAFDPVGRSTTP
jgi:uncharacterized protein